ncbi:Uncharacterised protein [Raoultella planticola]|uniref:Integrase catalytic domain-containing protein n=1 Tax=Raoultella planticola TaxID=575 RepID=A0A485AVU2_RAOPL|nr:transposase [Raoultella planticola ATCC 33531]VFS63358.1 Uncharacterised protein [Raoultella planticola]
MRTPNASDYDICRISVKIGCINSRFRDECLNEHWFSDILHSRKTINDWQQDCNECRPH